MTNKFVTKILIVHMPAYNMTVAKLEEREAEVKQLFKEVLPYDWKLLILPERETKEYNIEQIFLDSNESLPGLTEDEVKDTLKIKQ